MLKKLLIILFIFILPSFVFAKDPDIFLFLGGDSDWITKNKNILKNSKNIKGVQIIYTWSSLEKSKDVYDFSAIESDLQILSKLGKKLVVQIQDRTFSPQIKPVPVYMLNSKYYGDGVMIQSDNAGDGLIGSGWVAKQWNDNVRNQFQALLYALSIKFDGKIYGLNLPETAIDINLKDVQSGFTCDKYFNATVDNIKFLRHSFKKSYVIQYVNFFPCEWDNDHKYMERIFDLAIANNIGLGNPDTVPNKKAQMKNSYQFFNKYKAKLPLITIAIQEPDYTYINPNNQKRFTIEELANFNKEYLGANIVFWNVEEPYFSKDILPKINNGSLFGH